MKTKLAITAIVSFFVGTYAQHRFDKITIKKKAPEIIKEAVDKTWSEAFQTGWKSAVEDHSVRYRHYNEFKNLMEQS